MTEERRAALKRLIDHHTKVITTSREAARDALIEEGIYESNGKITAEYGGDDRGCVKEQKL